MISTVTTATVTIVTTASMTGTITLIGILILFVLLMQKEVATLSSISFMRRLSRVLDVGVYPFLFASMLTAIMKVVEVLH